MIRLFELSVLTVLTVEAISCSEVRKCCEPGEVLQDLEGGLSCVNSSLTVEINNLSPDSWGLPDCRLSGEYFYLSLEKIQQDNLHVSYSACLDNLYHNQTGENLPIIVYCDHDAGDLRDSQNSLKTPQVLTLRKCCPRGQYFNVDEKSCAFSEYEVILKSFLHISDEVDLLTLSTGAPVCEKILVNYVLGFSAVHKYQGKVLLNVPWKETYIDLTKQNDVKNICLDVDISLNVFVARVCKDRIHCNNNPCLRKCCPEGEAYFSETKCSKYPSNETLNVFHTALVNASSWTNSDLDTNDYGLLVGKTCKNSMYALLPEDEWSMTSEGYIHLQFGDTSHFHDEYCMEMFYNYSDYEDGIFPFVCFDDSIYETPKSVLITNGILQLISSFCLLITLLVYICLPTLQNLHGRTLMCHVASLALAYACLCLITLDVTRSQEAAENEKPDRKTLCSILGYTLLFAFISAFSWLNVMCFDIWWTFGNTRTPSGAIKSRNQRNRFLIYCLYAWGFACGITSLCILMDFTDIMNSNNRPRMGVNRCWFSRGLGIGEVIFFTGPVTIILLVNLVFFILTSMNYNKVKNQIRKVMVEPKDQRRLLEADRDKLVMNVKLFIVMGISWICEVISNYMNYFVPHVAEYQIFIVFDIINCLQGVFIFVLFIMKKRVYNALRQRLLERKDTSDASNMTNPYRLKKSSSNTTVLTNFVAWRNSK